MPEPRRRRRSATVFAAGVLASAVALGGGGGGALAGEVDPAGIAVPPTPQATCGPGSNPETAAQGRVPRSDFESGRAAQGYTCNAIQVGHLGGASFAGSGGYKVERYVDQAGHECAFYDTTLLFPANAQNLSSGDLTGVAVVDMTDPANPVRTTTLVTPAMQSPHESLSLNQRRGLLAAVSASPLYAPGILDVYDVTADCRAPVLRSSAPVGVLGHESGFAPDGNTFYVAALHAPTVVAIDVADATVPKVLGTYALASHGINLSDDGNRLYMASYNNQPNVGGSRGLVVYDVSEIQSRKLNPQMKEVSRTSWALVSTPQINLPVTIGGTPYLVEMDEFANGDRVGAARIIDITNDAAPRVVSNLRLEVNQATARQGEQADDPGSESSPQAQVGGYAGHYCNVPSRVDPGIVACTFILSGLRVFDIRDPLAPREIAYFNMPTADGAYAMSSPAFVPERSEIWYSDGHSGFYVVRITNGMWPFTTPAASADAGVAAGAAEASPPAATSGLPGRRLPATGAVLSGLAGLVALAAALGLRRLRR